VNGEAVKYYSDPISRYEQGEFPFAYPTLEEGRGYYHASVERDSKNKRWRVQMSLEYADYCGNLCAESFEIIRTIYFDDNLKVVGIEGDDEGAKGFIS
jgi:hypothetical protein